LALPPAVLARSYPHEDFQVVGLDARELGVSVDPTHTVVQLSKGDGEVFARFVAPVGEREEGGGFTRRTEACGTTGLMPLTLRERRGGLAPPKGARARNDDDRGGDPRTRPPHPLLLKSTPKKQA
jgi:hypothetical protein